jgi:hypothetical protein
MASLIPCAACSRHIRHHESQCPFCGAERTPTARAPREAARARDATRATLIALGLTVAGQARGGKEADRESDGTFIAPYGLPPFPEGGSGGGGTGGASGGGGDGGASQSGGAGGDSSIIPPYGAVPDPDGGSGGGADTPDSGAPDASSNDAGDGETDAGG